MNGATLNHDPFSPAAWRYLDEGGAHMIFEYAGSSGHFQSKILKLKKLSSVSPPSASALCFERPDDFTSVAANHIFGSSFPRHIPSCEYISLDKGLLEALNGLSSLDRPKFRKNVSSIDTNAPYGALMPNLRPPCHSRVMTVEIKPKCPEKALHNGMCSSCLLKLYKFRNEPVGRSSFSCSLRLCYATNFDEEYESNIRHMLLNPIDQRYLEIHHVPPDMSHLPVDKLLAAIFGHSNVFSFLTSAIESCAPSYESILGHYREENLNSPPFREDLKRSYSGIGHPQNRTMSTSSIARFLLYRSIRDCSLIANVALADECIDHSDGDQEDGKWTGICFQNVRLKYKIQLIDLDEKNAANIPKYKGTFDKALEYSKAVGHENICNLNPQKCPWNNLDTFY